MDTLNITPPDDWHLHLRDGAVLATTVAQASRHFRRGVVMPNLAPPITTTAQATAYRDRILAQRPPGSQWQPLMTLYLTDATPPDEIDRARASGIVQGVKYYPAGATTNAASGVTDIARVDAVLARMQQLGMPLLLHGEVTDADIDIFDREAVFIERHLQPLARRFPQLKIVLEHVTTAEAVAFVTGAPATIAATITPQHLLFNRNQLLVGGIRPHLYCLPVLKRRRHQEALIAAATGGNAKFFLGTDSAPHARESKESACGCAGCFSHPAALELYTEVFDRVGALDKLEGFASHHGADFYGLPRNRGTLRLERQHWRLAERIACDGGDIVPLCAGETLNWRIHNDQP